VRHHFDAVLSLRPTRISLMFALALGACSPATLTAPATVEFVADAPTTIARPGKFQARVTYLCGGQYCGNDAQAEPLTTTPGSLGFRRGEAPILNSYRTDGVLGWSYFFRGRIYLPEEGGDLRVHVDPPRPLLGYVGIFSGVMGSVLFLYGVRGETGMSSAAGPFGAGKGPAAAELSVGGLLTGLSIWAVIAATGHYRVEPRVTPVHTEP
jgi:hypothetical protein